MYVRETTQLAFAYLWKPTPFRGGGQKTRFFFLKKLLRTRCFGTKDKRGEETFGFVLVVVFEGREKKTHRVKKRRELFQRT